MKVHIAAAVLVPMVAIAGLRAIVHAQPTKSVWDGVYTEEQAKRGSPMYSEQCASCHGPELMGGEMAPPLATGDFVSGWDGLTIGDLFERIRKQWIGPVVFTLVENEPDFIQVVLAAAKELHHGLHGDGCCQFQRISECAR